MTTQTIINESKLNELAEKLYGIRPSSTKHLLHHHNEERRNKFLEFKQHLFEQDWVKEITDKDTIEYLNDDRAILRALEGYGWSFPTGVKVMKQSSEWRMNTKPHNIRLKELGDLGKLGLVQNYGFDKMGQPILYINTEKMGDISGQYELKFKNFIYGIERCLAHMPNNTYKITWIFDMRNAPISYSVIMNMKDMFLQLGDYYPEIIHVNIICNVSWTVNMLWKIASSFIEKTVLQRYFVFRQNDYDPSELYNFLHEHIEPEALLKKLGGPNENPWSYDAVVEYEDLLDQWIATKDRTPSTPSPDHDQTYKV
jgi:hypothetical protein